MSSSGRLSPTLLLPNQGSTPAAPPSGNVLLYAANGEPLVLAPGATVGTPLFRGFKNWLRNGGCYLWSNGQGARTAPTTPIRISTPSVATYHADGYFTHPYGTTVATQAAGEINVGGLKTPGAVQISGTAGCSGYKFGQRLPGVTTQMMAATAKYFTFSGFIYNQSGVTLAPQIQINVANSANNFGGVTGRQSAVWTSVPGGGVTRFSLTFAPNSYAAVGQGLEFTIWIPTEAAQAGWIQMGGFQVNEGGHALELEILPREIEAARSLAWSAHSYGYGATPGNTSYSSLCQVSCDDVNANQIPGQKFPTVMQLYPDVAIYSAAGALNQVSDVSYNTVAGITVVAADIGTAGFRCLVVTAGAYLANRYYSYHYQASCELI